MAVKPEDKPMKGSEVLQQGMGLSLLLMHVGATMYRLLFVKPGTMGCRAIGLLSVGVLLLYPAIVAVGPPRSIAGLQAVMWVWWALYIMLGVQFVASKVNAHERETYEVGRSWFSPKGEMAVAVVCSVAAFCLCPGLGYAIGGGYVCSLIQTEMIRARFRREVKIIRDAQRRAEIIQDLLED